MTTIEETEFLIHYPRFRETVCEIRLNMLDTAQKVNSKVERRVYKRIGSGLGTSHPPSRPRMQGSRKGYTR